MADNSSDLLINFFSKRRVTLQITVDLDPVPGAFSTPDDVRSRIQDMLDYSIGHYNPDVTLLDVADTQDGNAILRDLLGMKD
jgi:hypothetical protein